MTANNDELRECREAFEAHVRKLSPCTRLRRQNEKVGGAYRTVTVERSWKLWQAAWNTRANEAKGGEALAWIYAHEVNVLRERSNNVVAAAIHPQSELPDDAVKLYTSPRATAEDVRDAERYRLLRDAKDTKGFWISHGEYGRMSRWNGEPADRAIDQAIAGKRGDEE